MKKKKNNTKHIKTYKAMFCGRKKGAIGVFYPITTTINGTNKENARLNLYDEYEHIHFLTLKKILI